MGSIDQCNAVCVDAICESSVARNVCVVAFERAFNAAVFLSRSVDWYRRIMNLQSSILKSDYKVCISRHRLNLDDGYDSYVCSPNPEMRF